VSDSIWKKEISFRRKPNDDIAQLVDESKAEAKQSVWKKEISFGRKEKEETSPPVVTDAPEPLPVEIEIDALREKELEFQRRLQQVARAAEPSQAPAPVPAPVPVPAPAPEPESIWKKEISFRRKPAEARPERAAATAESAGDAPEPPVSIWKKEISFRKKTDGEPKERGDSIWTKDISLRRREARSAQVRALAEEALQAIEAAGTPPEPWLADPELPPEPVAEPVAQAPVMPPAEKKPSIWKREIGKPKKTKEPAQETAELPADGEKPKRERKPRTRLRDVKISLPKPAPKAKSGHPVKRLVGLKVGASQLAAARVNNNGAAELVQVARQPLEQGVVVGGEVRDPEALSLALKQFFATHKLPRKNVRLGIASNRIGVRIFDLVGIEDEKQLENAIRFRAQETLPIPLDEAVLDYHVLGESVDEDGTAMQRVLLVVAYRELVDRYVSACRKAGITLAGIDLEAFALLRALGAPRPEDDASDSALVAVAIGHDRSTFAVSDGRICEFTRVIEWGGATLSVAIARALDLAPSEVEQLKRLVSLESPAVPDGIDAQQYSLAVDAVRRQVQAFARELVSSLQFYQHQPGSLGIGEIVITGGTAGLAGLATELQGMIGVRVRVGDPLARMKVPKKLPVDEDLGSLAIAIGLGIED
jgi:type IV pilus assembly protein PilM